MKTRILQFVICMLIIASSCNKESTCDDSLSSTYGEAGECEYYYGGRDYGQLDVGSEIDDNNEYDVYVDGSFLGRVTVYFPNGLSCGNPNAIGKIYPSGTHVVRAVGNGGTVVREGNISLSPQTCKVVLIEDLPLANGGGTAGYVCVGGTCTYTTSGASYATYSECQTACGNNTTEKRIAVAYLTSMFSGDINNGGLRLNGVWLDNTRLTVVADTTGLNCLSSTTSISFSSLPPPNDPNYYYLRVSYSGIGADTWPYTRNDSSAVSRYDFADGCNRFMLCAPLGRFVLCSF